MSAAREDRQRSSVGAVLAVVGVLLGILGGALQLNAAFLKTGCLSKGQEAEDCALALSTGTEIRVRSVKSAA
jgi:hypothetical protein